MGWCTLLWKVSLATSESGASKNTRPSWFPSKFIVGVDGRLRPNASWREVFPGSWLNVAILSQQYSNLIPQYVRGDVLDLGCGKAPLFGAYRTQAESVVLSDWPSTRHGNRVIDVYASASEGLPFANDSFDTVIMSDVLEHLWSPKDALAEVRRVLKPGGVLLFNVPFYYWIHEEPHDYFRYTEYALGRMAMAAGLQVELLEPIGGVLASAIDTVAKACSVSRFGWLPALLLQRVAYLVGWKLFPRLAKVGRNMPIGYIGVFRRSASA